MPREGGASGTHKRRKISQSGDYWIIRLRG
jgi:hypothetical protein